MKGYLSSWFFFHHLYIWGITMCQHQQRPQQIIICSCVRFDVVFPQIGVNFNSTKESQTAFVDHNILDEFGGCAEVSF